MAPYFTNDSCNPFLPQNASCRLGNYISYAVNASGAADFHKTIQFVRRHNIRLTIRNTGHDYNGKATGAGAVGIWTHYMKAMTVFDYKFATYTGKAMKMGAGVQAIGAYQHAYDRGLAVIGGNCPTVGIAGGYTQGGGHSPLSSKFGMAADQALEWEVVTASGEQLVATPSQNADLFWALSGGGGGTYGAFPELMTSAANLTFTTAGSSEESFWDVVRTFHKDIPSIVDAGAYAAFLLSRDSFVLMPVQAPGVPKAQLERLLGRTLRKLEQNNIRYDFNIGEFPTYYESYQSYDPPWNVSQYQIGGRLIPPTLVKDNLDGLIEAERQIVDSSPGLLISGVCVNVSVANPAVNSVNPYWRTALFDAVIGTPYSYTNSSLNDAYADIMTNQLLPKLAKLTPDGGAYINEADFQQPDFQRVFYGAHYPALKAIKKKYDPFDMFYAITAVGSESWYEDQTRDGRLCRVA
ncbi:MAG: hypothetical protein Q9192_000977 [Flavoplaca navasiana]